MIGNFPIKNGLLYYEVQGAGPPLLLIRGLGRSMRHWLGFDKTLAKHFTVITVDNHGIGRSKAKFSWSHSLDDIAKDFVALLKYLGFKKVHVCGVSLGGMVALSVGLQFPEYIASLTIINSSIAGSRHPRLSVKAVTALTWSMLKSESSHRIMAKVLVSTKDQKKHQTIVEQWKKIEELESIPIFTVIKQLVACGRFNVRKKLPHLKVPALVIYGKNDAFVPTKNSEIIHQLLPHAELVALDHAGHELTIDQPEKMSKILQKFISNDIDTSSYDEGTELRLNSRQKSHR